MNEFLATLTTTEEATNPVTLPTVPVFALVFLFAPGATVGQKMLPGSYKFTGNVLSFFVRVQGTINVVYA